MQADVIGVVRPGQESVFIFPVAVAAGISGFQPEGDGEVGVEGVGDASPVVPAVELYGVAYLARYPGGLVGLEPDEGAGSVVAGGVRGQVAVGRVEGQVDL